MCTRQQLIAIPFTIRNSCDTKYCIRSYIGKGSSGIVFFSCHLNNCKYVMKIINTDISQLPRYLEEAKTLYHLGQLGLSAKWYDTFYCNDTDFSIQKLIGSNISMGDRISITNTFNQFIANTFNQFIANKSQKIFVVIISEYITGVTLSNKLSTSIGDIEDITVLYNKYIQFINTLSSHEYFPWDSHLNNFIIDDQHQIKIIDVDHMVHPWNIKHPIMVRVNTRNYRRKAMIFIYEAVNAKDSLVADLLRSIDSELDDTIKNKSLYQALVDPNKIYVPTVLIP